MLYIINGGNKVAFDHSCKADLFLMWCHSNMCARVHKTAADGHPDSNDNVGNVKNQNNNRDCHAGMTLTDVEVAKDIRSTKHS